MFFGQNYPKLCTKKDFKKNWLVTYTLGWICSGGSVPSTWQAIRIYNITQTFSIYRSFSVSSAQSKCHFLFGGLVIFLFQWCALRFSSNFQIRHLLLNLQWLIQSTETFPLSKEIGLNFEKVLFSILDILVISGRYTLSLF